MTLKGFSMLLPEAGEDVKLMALIRLGGWSDSPCVNSKAIEDTLTLMHSLITACTSPLA